MTQGEQIAFQNGFIIGKASKGLIISGNGGSNGALPDNVLYDTGIENYKVGGLWIETKGPSAQFYGTLTKYPDYIFIQGPGVILNGGESGTITSKLVDVTQYNKLKIKLNRLVKDSNKQCGFIACATTYYFGTYSNVVAYTSMHNPTNTEYEVDLSNVNGLVYILALGSSGGGIIEVSKIWLE